MSTYVHRIIQVKVSDKWETAKVYTEDHKNINNYSDNLTGLRYELQNRFRDQLWDNSCPKKEDWQYNHCWATLDQLESWESELTDEFFEAMKNAYSDTKLDQIISILNKEEYNQSEEYYDRVNEIKEDYLWDIISLNNIINAAYIVAVQVYDIYNTKNIRILFYYD